MGFKSKLLNLKDCAINSMIYKAYYEDSLDENLVYLESRDGLDFTGNIFRITQVTQDGLNVDGYYKCQYSLFSTNPDEIEWIHKQTVKHFVCDLKTIGGDDLVPVIGKEDYEYRNRIINR